MLLALAASIVATGTGQTVPEVSVAGDWKVRVSSGAVVVGKSSVRIDEGVTLDVMPADIMKVRGERYDSMPLFDDKAPPWNKGIRLKGLVTEETSAPYMLFANSLRLRTSSSTDLVLKEGTDYVIDKDWGTMGRLSGSALEGKSVWADYDYGRSRIDAVIANDKGRIFLRKGVSDTACPLPPKTAPDEIALANIWVPGRLEKLTKDNIYAIIEPQYPIQTRESKPAASKYCPYSWTKLNNKENLHILAWGDSVTCGGAASDISHRYQEVFVSLLKKRFNTKNITLTTAAWGGHNSMQFLQEPPGSIYNFDDAVIKPHPDLVISEFVNDSYMSPEQVEEKYSYLLKRFQEIGAEWIIITPHYVWNVWMGVPSVRIESDPRPYVAGLRQFAAKHNVALADASLRWGHLVKEGIPYITLLKNSLNHPDDRGHRIFALALMDLFGGMAASD